MSEVTHECLLRVNVCGWMRGGFFSPCLSACLHRSWLPNKPQSTNSRLPPPPPHTDLFKAGKGPDPKVAKAERAKSNLDTEMDAYWEAKKK